MNIRRLAGSLLLLALSAQLGGAAAQPASGVNMAGGEFGALPGQFETDYHYPSDREIAWAKSRGFSVVRAPFLWERLQPFPAQDLDPQELGRLKAVVESARKRGMTTILDAHNYGRLRGAEIGTHAASNGVFADLWKRIAAAFAGQDDVVFGLMNEPHDQSVDRWAASAQYALDAIRATGACNLVLVPGANWTGAHSWNAERDGVSNAKAMAGLKDKGVHLIEFHQYLDPDFSGTSGVCRKPEEITAAISVATGWLKANRKKGFLAEFGAGHDAQCQASLAALLSHMSDNADVWAGWTYWAAGDWWPDTYPLGIGPKNDANKPQLRTLAKFIGGGKLPSGCKK